METWHKARQQSYRRQSTTEHHRAPQSTTEHHRAPQSTTEHHRAPQSTTEHHRAPQSTTEHHRAPQSTTELPVQNASHATATECGISPSLGLSHKCCKLSGPLPRGTTKMTSCDAVDEAGRHDKSVAWSHKLLEACFHFPPVGVGNAGSSGLSIKVPKLECKG